MAQSHEQASPDVWTTAERLASSPTTGEQLAGREAELPNGLVGAAHGLVDSGYRALVSNPELTVRYETTTSPINHKGGVSDPARAQLEAVGITVADSTNPTPPGSRLPAPGQSVNAVNTFNGNLASQAIADRLDATPGASNVEQEVRYDAKLSRVDSAVRNNDVLGDRRVDVRAEFRHPTDPRLNAVLDVESKATRITPSTINETQVAHDAARLSRNGAMRGAGFALEGVGRVARPVGVVLDAVDVGGAYRADGNRVGENTGRAVSGLAGGAAGGWGGAVGGAAIGTAILPGVGTVVGGVIGAAAGAFGGDAAGRGIFNTVSSWFGS